MDEMMFRDLMSITPSPVTVITTAGDGMYAGSTVGAFMSLSLEPRLVMASLDNRSTLLTHIRRFRRFGVNLLADGQGNLARTFAQSRDDRFAGVDWRLSDGLPRLERTAAWIACTVAYELPAGDHTILAGLAESGEVGKRPALVYSGRVFGINSALMAPVVG